MKDEDVEEMQTIESMPSRTCPKPELTLSHVSKTFPARNGRPPVEALRDITGVVKPKEFISILGPSGCGKSTLLDLIAGLSKPTAGHVQLRSQVVDRPSDGVAVVFQEDSTLPWRTVQKNVEFPLEINGTPRRERRQRASEMLSLVGLASFADARPRELSGGMRQRVAIARALVSRPKILLMDEPFGALDQQTRLFVGEELRRIAMEIEQTIIFITHDISEAAYLGTEIWLLSQRPSVVRKTIDVPWAGEPDLGGVLRRPEFADLTGEVWEIIRDESKAAMRDDRDPSVMKLQGR